MLISNAGLPPVTLLLLATAGGWWGVSLLVLTLAAHSLLLWAILYPRNHWMTPLTASFCPEGQEVWLTIDDGPDGERTRELSAALRTRNVPATFFVIGRKLEHDAQVASLLQADGHTLANHTHTHPRRSFWCSSRSRVLREVEHCSTVLERVGVVSPLFRAPVGHKPPALARILAEKGLRLIAWTVGGRDGWSRSIQPTVHRFLEGVRPGAILTLHEGRAHSNATILAVVDALLDAGYAFVIPSQEQLAGNLVADRITAAISSPVSAQAQRRTAA